MNDSLFQKIEEKIGTLPEKKRRLYDLAKIKEAFEFALEAHKGQKRKSGDPYIVHPLETSLGVIGLGLDNSSVVAALLHDVPEDTPYTLKSIEKQFGKEIAFLVGGVTKLGRIKYRGAKNRTESIRKTVLAMAEDLRVILIKLEDRYHNMRTLDYLPENKQKRIALETLEIYAPLAYRLGMIKLAGDLEDLAFPYVYPSEFAWLMKNIEERRLPLEKYLEKITPIVRKRLEENNISVLDIYFRVKHYYSLFKKLQNYGMNFDRIYDIVALRIIVSTEADCYAVLGIIHKYWPPLPGKIKDYIAIPKPNGYRSLHTTVFCEEDRLVEIQIRTQEMHEEAENGIAAHWYYEEMKKKTSKTKVSFAPKGDLLWINRLREWQKQFSGSKEFLESFKIDFLKNRIFVLTPKGEAVDLPQGATPVDFAYTIHSDIGDHCQLAKVDGRIVPLDYELKTGEVVNIITNKNKKPSESWLKFVKTVQARRKIKSALRKRLSFAFYRSKPKPRKVEFRISILDQPGVLNAITRVISERKVNISRVVIEDAEKFPFVTIRCDLSDEFLAKQLSLKIRRIPSVKEVNYKLIK